MLALGAILLLAGVICMIVVESLGEGHGRKKDSEASGLRIASYVSLLGLLGDLNKGLFLILFSLPNKFDFFSQNISSSALFFVGFFLGMRNQHNFRNSSQVEKPNLNFKQIISF